MLRNAFQSIKKKESHNCYYFKRTFHCIFDTIEATTKVSLFLSINQLNSIFYLVSYGSSPTSLISLKPKNLHSMVSNTHNIRATTGVSYVLEN